MTKVAEEKLSAFRTLTAFNSQYALSPLNPSRLRFL